MTLYLLHHKCDKESPPNKAKLQSNIGPSGKKFVMGSDSIPGFPDVLTPYPSNKFSCDEYTMAGLRLH
jgi:hypothetical protein